MHNFLAMNQKLLLYLIVEVEHGCSVIHAYLHILSRQKLLCYRPGTAAARRQTETSPPEHFSLWQLSIGDYSPLAFIIMPLVLFTFVFQLVFSPHPHPSDVSSEGEAERLSCSQREASLLIMHQWHHYKSNQRLMINAGLIKQTGWWTNALSLHRAHVCTQAMLVNHHLVHSGPTSTVLHLHQWLCPPQWAHSHATIKTSTSPSVCLHSFYV